MTKIKSINISGVRGIRDLLTLDIDQKSILVYGDNGTGKSSLTDAFEWLFYDRIGHLSNEEIGRRKGRDALRNIFIPDNEVGYIEIQFDDNKLNIKKTIDNSISTSISNTSDEFNDFIVATQSENLILRYRDLVQFIIASKADKLTKLQNIIGFSKVADVRNLLRKSANRIARNIKSTNYDNRKNIQQSIVIENFGQPVYSDEQLFKKANEIIKPLNLDIDIKSFADIQNILNKIETKENDSLFKQISFFTRIQDVLSEVVGNVDSIHEGYELYYTLFKELQKDPEKIKKLQLLTLLKEGQSVLKNDVVQDNYCPLCQQEKSKIQLIQELNERIEELEQLDEEKNKLDEQKEELEQLIQPNINSLDSLLREILLKSEECKKLKGQITEIKESFNAFFNEFKKDLSNTLVASNKIRIDKTKLSAFVKKAQETAKTLTRSQSANIKFQIYTKLFRSVTAYAEYQKIEKERHMLARQQDTFEALYADFIKRQEKAISIFLTMFSQNINDYFTIMNPKEKIEDIKLVPIKKDGDLVGITLECSFFDETKAFPIAYLSESHINCLGLSFFLASVKAFNKENEFFILDDIISSYDRSHRARFAKLLIEKFSDYQIILLTHEQEFFELISSDVKGKGWLIKNFKWTENSGTCIEKEAIDIKERILKKFEKKNTDGLGNDIRVYAEKVMKNVAFNIEALVAFRYNELNEKRMVPELLDSIQSKILKKGTELTKKANIAKLKGMPMFIGNTASHDNKFNESIEDLEMMWESIENTIHAFYCIDCSKYLSIKYFDNVKKKIRCSCDNLNYPWKE